MHKFNEETVNQNNNTREQQSTQEANSQYDANSGSHQKTVLNNMRLIIPNT